MWATLSASVLAGCVDTGVARTQIGAVAGAIESGGGGANAQRVKSAADVPETGTLDAHDQSHLTQSTQSAIATGERQEWNNPDTGTSVAIDVKSTTTLHHRIDVLILKGTV